MVTAEVNLQIVAKKLHLGSYFPNARAEALEIATNASILYSEFPATQAAQKGIEECDQPDVLEALAAECLYRFFLRAIRKLRAVEMRKQRVQLPLPGFEALPEKIPGRRKIIALEDATRADIRVYCGVLRKQADARRISVVAHRLLKIMDRYAATTPRIKVKEALRREAESQPR